jgi:membrane protein implicated in regulation of membrane protease activity
MIMLASSVAIAWLMADVLARRESSPTRQMLLACSFGLCVAAKQVEAILAWASDVPQAAFRLHLRVGPVLAEAVKLSVFGCVGLLHASRRNRLLTLSSYLASVWESMCYIAPSFLLVLIFASTAALFLVGLVDRLADLLIGRHIGAQHLSEWRLQGAMFMALSSLYVEVQRRVGAAVPLLPSHAQHPRAGAGKRIIDANGCIRHR